jgi:hypothetical protein
MTDTTLEEARRCPKCEQPGQEAGEQRVTGRDVTRGAKLRSYLCMNQRCRWYGQVCRLIQINPDGTIPQPSKREKSFPTVPDLTQQVNDAVERQLRLELGGGAEIHR